MIKSTHVLSALLGAAVFLCALFAYLWIDRSISLSYSKQSIETANRVAFQFERILQVEWQGLPEAELMQKLKKAAARMPDHSVIIKKEGDVIWFDEIRFTLAQGRLSSVGDPERLAPQ